jgi:hypothetical protein
MKRKPQLTRTGSLAAPRSMSTVHVAVVLDQSARTTLAEADPPVDAVLARGLAQVLEDRRAVGDRLGTGQGKTGSRA